MEVLVLALMLTVGLGVGWGNWPGDVSVLDSER